MKTQIKTTKTIYPQIYAYVLPDYKDKNGWIKIGYTERLDVDKRIKEQTHTAAVNFNYEKLWSEPAKFQNPAPAWFTDKDFHRYLCKFKKVRQQPKTEWFFYNGNPDKSYEDFKDFIQRKGEQVKEVTAYQLREEQLKAVDLTLAYVKSYSEGKFLWNAKPRFGKTLAAYDLIRKTAAEKVLIVTNRPAIATSWYDDFEKFIAGQTDYKFISTADSLKEKRVFTREKFIALPSPKAAIAFLSLQDLKGAVAFGGRVDKLAWVKDLEWDILIIDEAHEGVATIKTETAFENIKRNFTLHLSGTPFKALASGTFTREEIFNWTYEDEQEAKAAWTQEHGDELNPYQYLPRLNLFSYQMSKIIEDEVNKGVRINGKNIDYAFDLNEFFATDKNGVFVYESDVKNWLDTLTGNEKYPFSTKELRDELKHTLWLLNRVDSAKALQKLLAAHPVFKDYEIILAAGDGKQNEDEQLISRKAFTRVQLAVKDHDKTITLSVGQLTTGVTVPEWTAVLMLSDTSSPGLYMQSAFRAQNPWIFESEGKRKYKENAYVFDFSPQRTLIIYDEFANNLSQSTANGLGTTGEREDNIRKLLNFFPVIAEDPEGKMQALDVNQVLTIPKVLKAQEVVKRGFMSNLLFQNISGIFAAESEEVKEILEQLHPVDTGKTVARRTEEKIDTQNIQIDDNNNVVIAPEIIVSDTKAHFGEKVYENITDATAELLKQENKNLPAAIADSFKKNTQEGIKNMATANGLTAKQAEQIGKQNSNALAKEIELITIRADIKKKEAEVKLEKQLAEVRHDERATAAAKECYEQEKIKLNEEWQSDILATVEHKTKELTQQATAAVLTGAGEKKKNTVEDEVRARLRGFSRTIPSFLMAYGQEDTTLENFERTISDQVFKEVTGITLEQFRTLRDKHNFFNSVVFNESVQEFLRKRLALANYFDENIKEDIFDYIPPQKTNQIYTPKKTVQVMIDDLEKENPDIFKDKDRTFADLYVKSGLYITEIVKRLYKGLETVIPDDRQRLKHIFAKQVYGFAPTEIIYKIACRFIFGFDEQTNNIDKAHIVFLDTTPYAKKEAKITFKEKFNELFKVNNMKFDAVVGNPPYQEKVSNSGSNQHDMPVYHYFYDLAAELSDKYILISPARFLTGSGYTPKEWNRKMLADVHVRVAHYYPKSSEVFPNTDIKGGYVL